MTAKKSTVETVTYTTFTIPLDELLDAYVPAEERHKPLCTWWVSTSVVAGMIDLVRSERTAIAYDEEGRERLEEDERERTTHNDL